MSHTRFRSLLLAVAALVLAGAAPGRAADLDVRAGSYTKLEKAFVGLGLLSRAGHQLYFNPNVEYVFVDHGHFGTLNFDFHYDLPLEDAPYVWIGGGLALVHNDPDGPNNSETNARANILAGVGLHTRGAIPYVQAKYLTGYEEWVLAAGIRF